MSGKKRDLDWGRDQRLLRYREEYGEVKTGIYVEGQRSLVKVTKKRLPETSQFRYGGGKKPIKIFERRFLDSYEIVHQLFYLGVVLRHIDRPILLGFERFSESLTISHYHRVNQSEFSPFRGGLNDFTFP